MDEIIAEGEVHNLSGNIPGRYALWAAIKRVRDMGQDELLPKSKYVAFFWRPRFGRCILHPCCSVATRCATPAVQT